MHKYALKLICLALLAQPVLAQDHSQHTTATSSIEIDTTVVATLGELEILGPFSRATLPNARSGGAYFAVRNNGSADDVILSAATSAAEITELHEMAVTDGVMRMRELTDGIPVPAGETVVLAPSGLHVMLMGLTQPLVEGQVLALTIEFQNAGAVSFDVPIGSTAQH